MNQMLIFMFNAMIAAGTIRLAISVALTHGITDQPGDHKQHCIPTPFVGGVGIFLALLAALIILIDTQPEQTTKWLSLGLGAAIIFATGFVDDLKNLNYKVRLIIQTIVALIMILGGNVVLSNLGGLVPNLMLELGLLAIPFTIFATIGVINALNMIDGVDGLSGTLSFISLLLISAVALIVGDVANLTLAIALAGSTVGFLYFNLRFASKRRARVFLGDNGSMLLGFLFAWLFVDLSQSSDLAMTPVTAIWLFAMPLMDTISVMHRRILLGKSPFAADRQHLHHLLLRAGFPPQKVVFFVGSFHLLFGMIGLAGWYIGIPEFIMLIGFLLAYAAYFYLTMRLWWFIPMLNWFLIQLDTSLKFAPTANSTAFFGRHSRKDIEAMYQAIRGENNPIEFYMRAYKQHSDYYALTLSILPPENGVLDGEFERQIVLLQQRLIDHGYNIQLRRLTVRDNKNVQKLHNQENSSGLCLLERRELDSKYLEFEILFSK
jgi:UDP-GlcNAc:undecaprenyl-phosphate GlcNAc-1-phosphate transferase